MRVIGGDLKGKKILFLKTSVTRPLRDLVKESIFNVLQHSNMFNVKIDNAKILDLYSGIGSFGLECISRKANHTIFVESSADALGLLRENIKNLMVEEKCSVYQKKNFDFVSQIDSAKQFDIFFLDPPFSESNYIEELKVIKERKLYKENHIIILHREKCKLDSLQKIIKVLVTKKYGRSFVIFGVFA